MHACVFAYPIKCIEYNVGLKIPPALKPHLGLDRKHPGNELLEGLVVDVIREVNGLRLETRLVDCLRVHEVVAKGDEPAHKLEEEDA